LPVFVTACINLTPQSSGQGPDTSSRLLGMIIYLQICNSTRLKHSIT
jgi:hypothetical protein